MEELFFCCPKTRGNKRNTLQSRMSLGPEGSTTKSQYQQPAASSSPGVYMDMKGGLPLRSCHYRVGLWDWESKLRDEKKYI